MKTVFAERVHARQGLWFREDALTHGTDEQTTILADVTSRHLVTVRVPVEKKETDLDTDNKHLNRLFRCLNVITKGISFRKQPLITGYKTNYETRLIV